MGVYEGESQPPRSAADPAIAIGVPVGDYATFAAVDQKAGEEDKSSKKLLTEETLQEADFEKEEPNYWKDRYMGCFSTNLMFLWFGFVYLVGFQLHSYMCIGFVNENVNDLAQEEAKAQVPDVFTQEEAENRDLKYIGRFYDTHTLGLVLGTLWAIGVQAFANAEGNCLSRFFHSMNKVTVKWRISVIGMASCLAMWMVGYGVLSCHAMTGNTLMLLANAFLAANMAWFQACVLQLCGGLRSESGGHWYLIGVSTSSVPTVILGMSTRCGTALTWALSGFLVLCAVFTYFFLDCGVSKHDDMKYVVYQELKDTDGDTEVRLCEEEGLLEGDRSPGYGRAGEADATEEVSVCTVIKRNWAMLITMWWTFVVMFFGIIQIGFHKTSWACFQYDAVDHKGDPRLNKDGTQKIDYTVWQTTLLAVCLFGDILARVSSYFLKVDPTKCWKITYYCIAWAFRPLLMGVFAFFLFSKASMDEHDYSAYKMVAYLVLGFSSGFLCNGIFACAMGGAQSNEEREKLGPMLGLMLVFGIFSGTVFTGKIMIPWSMLVREVEEPMPFFDI